MPAESRHGIIIQDTADKVWEHVLATDASVRSRRGLQVERLQVDSLDEHEHEAAFAQQMLDQLEAVPPASELGPEDATMVAYLRHLLSQRTKLAEAWWWQFALTPYSTYAIDVYGQQVFSPYEFADDDDVERYAGLLGDLATLVDTSLDKTLLQLECGWALPAPALQQMVSTWEAHAERMAAYTTLNPERTAKLAPATRGRLDDAMAAQAGRLAESTKRVLDHLRGRGAETATPHVGLAQYPGGDAAYAWLVAMHATYPIGAQDVHDMGVAQMDQLSESMARIRAAEGFTGTEDEYLDKLRSDPRYLAHSPEDVEAVYRRHIANIEPVMAEYFRVGPDAAHDVRRMEPSMEAGVAYGYYQPPTVDDHVGRFRYNGSGLEARSQMNAAPIIFHELIPGHHFHVARQVENTDLHPVRSELAHFTAFAEGWAEYAADVAGDMGMYADPWDEYGYLLHQRFLVQRLVTDTGLNALGWSLDRARQYMASVTTESAAQIDSETLRYATDMPGQALGYRLGHTRLLELRETARQRLGDRFDIRDFHEAVLAPGALPLSVVETNINRYVAEAADQAASV